MAHFLRKDICTTFAVTVHEPGHVVTIESREGSSFPMTVTRRVEATGEGSCHVDKTVDGEPAGFYRLAEPLLRAMVARNIRRDYTTLKGRHERR